MKVQEYLSQVHLLNERIRQKEQELYELEEMVLSIRAMCIDGEKIIQQRTDEAPFVKIIEKIIDMRKVICKEIEIFLTKKHEVINKILELKDKKYIELLYKRYVEYKSFAQIAMEMHYAYHYITRLHGYALQEMSKIL